MKQSTSVACIGVGMIGRSWAISFARAGHRVVLFDSDEKTMRDAVAFASAVDGGALSGRIGGTQDISEALAGALYVQESAPEDLALKRALFEELDAKADEATIFGSSTSTLPGSEFLCGLKISPRALVAHPTNPPHIVPLVEMCRTTETDDDAFRGAWHLMEGCGQVPVQIRKEVFGFALNRLQAAVVAESIRLVRDGVISVTDLDLVMTQGLGLRWAVAGPFETGHLNSRGGYKEYMSKFADAWKALFKAVGSEPEFDHALMSSIDAELRHGFGGSGVHARQERRDRTLERLRSFLDGELEQPRSRRWR